MFTSASEHRTDAARTPVILAPIAARGAPPPAGCVGSARGRAGSATVVSALKERAVVELMSVTGILDLPLLSVPTVRSQVPRMRRMQ